MSEIVYFKRGEQVEAANVKSQLFNRLSRDGEWTRVEVETEEPQQAEEPIEVVIQEQAPEEASLAPEAQPQVTQEEVTEEPQQAEEPIEVVIQEQAPEEASLAPEAQPQVTQEEVTEEPKKGKK
jgi:hypothetical protein